MKRFILLILPLLLISSCAEMKKPPTIVAAYIIEIPEEAGKMMTVYIRVSNEENMGSIEIYNGDTLIATFKKSGYLSFPAPFGTVRLTIVVCDSLGRISDTVSLQTFKTYDLSPPKVEIKIIPESPIPGDTVTVDVEAKDSESGIGEKHLYLNQEEVSIPYSFTARAGVYNFTAWAVNNAGLRSSSSKKLIVSDPNDTISPSIDVVYPKIVQPYEDFDIFVSATDNTGLKSIKLEDLGGVEAVWVSGKLATVGFTRTAGIGDYHFKVVVEDMSGNVASKEGTIEVRENKPPSVSINLSSNSPKEGEEVEITAIVEDDTGVKEVRFYVDSSLISIDMIPPYTASWIAEKGVHKIKVVAVDDEGLEGSAEVGITVEEEDKEPPRILFSCPDDVILGEPVTFYAVVTDNVGVEGVIFKFEGTGFLEEKKASNLSTVYYTSISFPSTGTYSVVIEAWDVNGNEASVTSYFEVKLEEEIKPPRIINMSMVPSVVNKGEYVYVTVSAEDDTGLERCDFYVDNDKMGSSPFENGVAEWRWLATVLGTHVLKAVVHDVEGYTTSATDEVCVVSDTPIVEILSPKNMERFIFQTGMTLSLSARVLDTATPLKASFRIMGPVDEEIEVFPESEGAVHLYSHNWVPDLPGTYSIEFSYDNVHNLHASTEVTIRFLDTHVIFKTPYPGYQHEAGFSLNVVVETSKDVASGTIILTKPDGEKVESTPYVEIHGDTYHFVTTFNKENFMIICNENEHYTLRFVGKADDLDVTSEDLEFLVKDTLPPTMMISLTGGMSLDIEEEEMYNVILGDYKLSVEASDNHSVNKISLYKDGNFVTQSPESYSLEADIEVGAFENEYEVIAEDESGNREVFHFTLYGYEKNPPQTSPFTLSLSGVTQPVDINSDVYLVFNDFTASDDTAIDRVCLKVDGPATEERIIREYPDHPKEISVKRSEVGYITWRTPSVPGLYTLSLVVIDVFGNKSDACPLEVEVSDITPPLVGIEILTPAGVTEEGVEIIRGNNVSVRVYYMDNTESIRSVTLAYMNPDGTEVILETQENVAGYYYIFNNVDTTPLMDGFGTLIATVVTESGIEGKGDVTVLVDNMTRPVFNVTIENSVTFDDEKAIRENAVLRINPDESNTIPVPYDVGRLIVYISDDENVDESDVYMIFEEPPDLRDYALPINTKEFSDGRKRVAIKVVDKAGNESDVERLGAFEDVIFDNTPPRIPGETLTDNSANIVFGFEDVTIVSTPTLILDGSYFKETSINGTSVTYDLSSFLADEATMEYTFKIFDIVGNYSEGTGVLLYDLYPPTLAITIDSSTFKTIFEATVNYLDNISGVATLLIQLDTLSSEVNVNERVGSYLYTYDIPEGFEGTVTFSVIGYDELSHSTQVATQIIFDNHTPEITNVLFDEVSVDAGETIPASAGTHVVLVSYAEEFLKDATLLIEDTTSSTPLAPTTITDTTLKWELNVTTDITLMIYLDDVVNHETQFSFSVRIQ